MMDNDISERIRQEAVKAIDNGAVTANDAIAEVVRALRPAYKDLASVRFRASVEFWSEVEKRAEAMGV